MTTIYVLGALFVYGLIWEANSILTADVWTISRALQYLAQEWSLLIPYALNVLSGHVFIQPPARYTLASHFGEPSEVILILLLGWFVHLIDKALSPALPWWGYLLFCVGSLLVGAFAWTLGV